MIFDGVAIIDYGVGNIGSIINMFKRIGTTAKLTASAEDIRSASKLILPGVGAFDQGVKALKQSDLISILEEQVFDCRKPILGICLGMQLLLNASEEGVEPGLGWIPGRSIKFDAHQNNIKVPHMGWNIVKPATKSILFDGLDQARFYFVHSYRVHCDNPEHCLAVCHYGNDFTAAIHKDNIYGVQFHPEKSHRFGMQLLKNFVELPC